MSMSPRLLRPRASGFTPASLGATLSMWYDADDAASITLNGSTVSQWNDKSANARHISQGTASQQPTYETNKLNAKPAILFDGSNDILSTSASGGAGVTNASVFAVMRYVAASAEDLPIVIGKKDTADLLAGHVRAFYRGSGGNTQGFATWAIDQPTSAYATDTGGSYHIFGFRQTGSTVQIRRNGAGTNYTLSSTPNAVVGNNFSMGSIVGNVAASYYSNVSVAEVVVLYSYASDDNTSLIEKYLSSKWGIALV